MSTRGQILFEGDEPGSVHPVMIYKHSDSYPEGVIPVPVPFVRLFFRFRVAQVGWDPEYLSAQVVRAFALAGARPQCHSRFGELLLLDEEQLRRLREEDFWTGRFEYFMTTGWGLTTRLVDWIDFLYLVRRDGSVGAYDVYGVVPSSDVIRTIQDIRSLVGEPVAVIAPDDGRLAEEIARELQILCGYGSP